MKMSAALTRKMVMKGVGGGGGGGEGTGKAAHLVSWRCLQPWQKDGDEQEEVGDGVVVDNMESRSHLVSWRCLAALAERWWHTQGGGGSGNNGECCPHLPGFIKMSAALAERWWHTRWGGGGGGGRGDNGECCAHLPGFIKMSAALARKTVIMAGSFWHSLVIPFMMTLRNASRMGALDQRWISSTWECRLVRMPMASIRVRESWLLKAARV